MAQLKIVPHGDAAAVVLPDTLLKSLGLRIGDTVDVNTKDQQVILRAADDTSRREAFERISEEILTQRQDAYRRLA